MNLKGKKILLGISGGIAAYKTPYLVRAWEQAGAEIEIVMTRAAQQFVTPLTLETVSGKMVHHELFPQGRYSATEHIDLADWAEAVVIAPATANIIAKIAQGIGDDLLSTVCLAAHYKLMIAPAMNSNMWDNPAVQQNINTLQNRGVVIVPPDSGDLACGYVGKGRLPDTEVITQWLKHRLTVPKALKGKTVLITAGRTEEELDPVRIITNRSSGKMGFALAREAFYRGANVVLVSGPNNLQVPDGIEYYPVVSATEMLKTVQQHLERTDIVIAAAAVSDYRPAKRLNQKLKKGKENLTTEFIENPDILQYIGNRKENKILVGFAVETNNEKDNALSKLKRKKLDLIVVNNPLHEGAGFQTDTNRVTIFSKDGKEVAVELMSKEDIAEKIFDQIQEVV